MDENDAVSVQKITGMNLKFEEILKEARKTEPLLPDVSLGYKIFDGKDEIEEAVKKADEYMYEIKKNKKHSC